MPERLYGAQVRAGAPVSQYEIVKFAQLFNDELTLDNLERIHLVNLCRFVGIQPFGTDAFLVGFHPVSTVDPMSEACLRATERACVFYQSPLCASQRITLRHKRLLDEQHDGQGMS